MSVMSKLKKRFKKNYAIVRGKKMSKAESIKQAVEEGKRRRAATNPLTAALSGVNAPEAKRKKLKKIKARKLKFNRLTDKKLPHYGEGNKVS